MHDITSYFLLKSKIKKSKIKAKNKIKGKKEKKNQRERKINKTKSIVYNSNTLKQQNS